MGIPLLSRLACFALCVSGIARPAGVVGHLRSSCVGMWGRFCLLRARRIPYRLRPVPRAVQLPVSLRFVIRPVLRHGGRGVALRLSSSAGSSLVLVACRAWGVMACPHGVLSSLVVLAVVREGVLCGLCGGGGCLSFLWYICIIN